MCIRKESHTQTFVCDAKNAIKWAAHPRFRSTTILQQGKYYLITLAKKRITQNVPLQMAISILNLASKFSIIIIIIIC